MSERTVGYLSCGRLSAHPPHDICPGVMSLDNPYNAWSDVLLYPYAIEERYTR